MQTDSNSDLKLQKPGEDGKAPESVLKDAQSARDLAGVVVAAGEMRKHRYAALKGMLDGNPPYNPAKLRVRNQAWRSNVPSMEGKALLSNSLVPDYDIFNGAPNYAEVAIDMGGTPDENHLWSQVVSEEFDLMLKAWNGFDFAMQAMLHDRKFYGRAFLFWADPFDWRFSHVPQGRVFVPDGTECYTGAVDVLVIEQNRSAHQLWRCREHPGYNKQAILRAIAATAADNDMKDPEKVQQRLRDNDLMVGAKVPTVTLWHVFVREYSGKVSWYMVSKTPLASQTGTDNEFIYQKREAYDDLNQGIAQFFFETLDGSWNGASGIGKDIEGYSKARDRLLNSVIDAGIMQSSIVLKAATPGAIANIPQVQFGPITVIPQEVEVQPGTIFANIDGPLKVGEYLGGVVSFNTGVYRMPQQRAVGNPETATAQILRQQNATTLTNSAVTRLYNDLDRLYEEVYRRAVQPGLYEGKDGGSGGYRGNGEVSAREFQKRCQARGVPIEAMRKPRWVRAYRSFGNGSVIMRQQTLAALQPFVALYPESGRMEFARDVTSAFTSTETAQRYAPKGGAGTPEDDQAAFATLENAVLAGGQQVILTGTQNDVVHGAVHIGFAMQAVQAGLGGQMDPQAALGIVQSVGQHAAQHLARLDGQPLRQREFDALSQQWDQVIQAAQELKSAAQQQQEQAALAQEAQAVQMGQDPDSQIKFAKASQDLQIKREKADELLRQKREKHAQGLAMADASTAANLVRTQASHTQQMAQARQANRMKTNGGNGEA